jgi:hypothetical protein
MRVGSTAQRRATCEGAGHEQRTIYCLDVHAKTIAVAVVTDGEVRSMGVIPNRPESIRKLVKKLGPAEGLRVCYEGRTDWRNGAGTGLPALRMLHAERLIEARQCGAWCRADSCPRIPPRTIGPLPELLARGCAQDHQFNKDAPELGTTQPLTRDGVIERT